VGPLLPEGERQTGTNCHGKLCQNLSVLFCDSRVSLEEKPKCDLAPRGEFPPWKTVGPLIRSQGKHVLHRSALTRRNRREPTWRNTSARTRVRGEGVFGLRNTHSLSQCVYGSACRGPPDPPRGVSGSHTHTHTHTHTHCVWLHACTPPPIPSKERNSSLASADTLPLPPLLLHREGLPCLQCSAESLSLSLSLALSLSLSLSCELRSSVAARLPAHGGGGGASCSGRMHLSSMRRRW